MASKPVRWVFAATTVFVLGLLLMLAAQVYSRGTSRPLSAATQSQVFAQGCDRYICPDCYRHDSNWHVFMYTGDTPDNPCYKAELGNPNLVNCVGKERGEPCQYNPDGQPAKTLYAAGDEDSTWGEECKQSESGNAGTCEAPRNRNCCVKCWTCRCWPDDEYGMHCKPDPRVEWPSVWAFTFSQHPCSVLTK